jgi:hypothetical protein
MATAAASASPAPTITKAPVRRGGALARGEASSITSSSAAKAGVRAEAASGLAVRLSATDCGCMAPSLDMAGSSAASGIGSEPS